MGDASLVQELFSQWSGSVGTRIRVQISGHVVRVLKVVGIVGKEYSQFKNHLQKLTQPAKRLILTFSIT